MLCVADLLELQQQHYKAFNNALYRIRKLRRLHLGRANERIPSEQWERTKQFIYNKIKKGNPIRWKDLKQVFG